MSNDNTVHKGPDGLEFIINEDGSVTFVNLPPHMIDVARALNPDAVIACDLDDDSQADDEESS